MSRQSVVCDVYETENEIWEQTDTMPQTSQEQDLLGVPETFQHRNRNHLTKIDA